MDNDEQDTRERVSISSGHFSHDWQVVDALNYLTDHHRDAFQKVLAEFPELDHLTMEEGGSSWFDTDAMGVDQEWSSWLTDAIEDTGYVWWEDGEPWAYRDGES